ncbi:MAG: response regulator, partial [Eubacteriales bacterium]|nr:response regulator [Eubacteriales bacterium]
MEKARILIVEDEWVTAEDIRQTVEGMGYEVVAAVASGEQAIEKVQKEGADLVLMDIILQGDMDGITAGSKIYSELGIPVVYLTAHADEATLQRAKSTGPFGYILKPFNERDLRSGIEVALERSRSERSIAHINSVLRTIRRVNQLVREEKDADVMIQKACDALVGFRGYGHVRIALSDGVGNFIKTVECGSEKGVLPRIELLKDNELSPVEQKALNQAGVVVVPIQTLLSAHGFQPGGDQKQSALLTRLEHDGRIYGLLMAAISAGLATAQEELELFGELASEIAFGLHDIATEEKGKKTEVALVASEKRYHRMINNSADGVLIIDEKGMVRFANPAAENILCRKQDRLVGQSFGFPMAASGTTELDVVCGEGRVIVAEMRVSETEYEGQALSLAALRDITQHKQTQASLEQTLDKLSRAMTATVGVVAMTVEARDPYTAGHQRRVAELAR